MRVRAHWMGGAAAALVCALSLLWGGCTADEPTSPAAEAVSTSGQTDSGPALDAAQTGTGPMAMITVHADPDGLSDPRATPENWERLAALVAQADSHGHKLTLLFGATWMELLEDNTARRMALKAWINNGHQAGFHHHTCGHASPDGYRDVGNELCVGISDRGSVSAAFAKVKDLVTSLDLPDTPQNRVDTAAQGPNTNNVFRAVEWQADAVYATGEMSENGDGHGHHRFITRPRCTTNYGNRYEGPKVTYSVAEMGHSQLDVGSFTQFKSDNNLAALTAEIDEALGDDHVHTGVHIGIVFHAREYAPEPRTVARDSYADDRAYLDAVMQLLADRGVRVVTVRDILSAADPCVN